MPKSLSKKMKANMTVLSGGEHPIALIEIRHPLLANPIRLANSRNDIQSQGETYIACAFQITLPDEQDQNLPRAVLSITNIGRKLSYWVERTIGAKDAQVRIIVIQKSCPDDHEWSIDMDMINVSMTIETIETQLGFDDLLNKPAVPVIYNTEKAPGLF